MASWFTWLTTIAFIVGWWYFNFDMDFLFIVGIFHLIFTIPALYLHIEYTIANAGEEIEFTQNEIIISKHDQKRQYHRNDFAKIIEYKSASLDKKGIPLLAMEYYWYVRIIPNEGDDIIITNLMSLDIDEILKSISGVPYERRKNLFCTTKLRG